MNQVIMKRIVGISLLSLVLMVASNVYAAKSVNYYVNQVSNKVQDIDREFKKVDFGAKDGDKNYDMVMKTITKLEIQCNKIQKAFKLNNPKTYDYKSVERARTSVRALKTSLTAKYKQDKANAKARNIVYEKVNTKTDAKANTGANKKNLKTGLNDTMVDHSAKVKLLYARYETFKPKLNVKKSKKNPGAATDHYKQVLVELKDRLDSFETDKMFVVALSTDSKWKNNANVKRLLTGFTSKNRSYNYKMKLKAMQNKLIGHFDVTRMSNWKKHVASLKNTPEQMYTQWKKNTPSLVKQVASIKAKNDAYANLMGKDKTWQEVNRTHIKLKTLADKTFLIYLNSVSAPKDLYSGRDKAKLKSEIKKKWMSMHKRDTILDVRLPAEVWKQNVSVDVSDAGTYLLKIERRHLEKMPLAVIVKGQKDRAFIYWGGIYKNKTNDSLHYSINDKSGKSGYVVEEMLEKNIK
ncbi:MAG: hypothetical protein KKC46_10540 [Proteobacteria bacterium]|nr:hypothetical protein [Pseudomonadota bacterium]